MDKLSFQYDVFIIPFKDAFLFYVPQKGIVFIIDENRRNEVEKIKSGQVCKYDITSSPFLCLLDDLKLLGQSYLIVPKPLENGFNPTSVTLSLTTRCSLRCIYCYARAGEKQKDMPMEIAQAAVNLLKEQIIKTKEKVLKINFHGQGEPTANWSLFVNIINYTNHIAKENSLKVDYSMSTNCIFSDRQREFIAQIFRRLSASIDGMPSIQNKQRPLPSGKGSFDIAYETLKYFDANNISYGIRATVLPDSVSAMVDSTTFIAENFNTDRIHFEPVFESGRAKNISIDKDQFYSSFVKEFFKAERVGEKHNIHLAYSGCRYDKFGGQFCGATGPDLNFVVTTDGLVTSCYEVTDRSHPKGWFFIYGEYDKALHEFVIDQQKVKYLQSISVDRMVRCRNCFIKWNCAGDCLARQDIDLEDLKNGEKMREMSPRCLANKEITIYELAKEAIRQTARFYQEGEQRREVKNM
jgi:uncharacterized protein